MKRIICSILILFLTMSMSVTIMANEVPVVDDGHESYYGPIELMAMGDYEGNLTGATWYWPIHGYSSASSAYSKITSSYGYRGGSYNGYHKGVDIGESRGTAVYSVRNGTVSVVDNSTGGSEGRSIIINHNDGYWSVYMHLSSINVTQGQTVTQNTKIGAVGGSGYNEESYYANHLHLGIHYGNSFSWNCNVNPCPSGYTRKGNSLQESAGGYPIGSASIAYAVSNYLDDTKIPEPPQNVAASSNGSQVLVTWDASDNAVSYDVYLIQNPWGWPDIKYSKSVTGTTSCYFYGVDVGDYKAFVIARPNADTVQSDWVSVSVRDVPAEPTGVTVKTSGAYATVSWNPSRDASDYECTIVEAEDGFPQVAKVSTSGKTTCDIELDTGTYYAYVVAKNAGGNSAQSDWVCFNINTAPLKAPTLAVPSSKYGAWAFEGDEITISWDKVDGAVKYLYYLAEYPYAYAYTTYTRTGNTTNNYITFDDLPNGRYAIFVHAIAKGDKRGKQSNWRTFEIYKEDYIPVATKEYNGHLYAVYDEEMAWNFARDLCFSLSGYLCTVNDEEESLFINDLIDFGQKDAYWLGAQNQLYDGKENTAYTWVTGESFDYTNWHSGEPSYSGEKGEAEAFLEVRKSYGKEWNDVKNTNYKNKGFLLEIDLTAVQPAKTMVFQNNTYHVYDHPLTWTEAAAFCAAKGGQLVEYGSEAELLAVNEMAKVSDRPWHYIGGIKKDGTWIWNSGGEISFSDYLQQHTYNDSLGFYLMQYMSGKVAGIRNVYHPLVDHQSKLGFICEIENTHNTISYDLNGGEAEQIESQYKEKDQSIKITDVVPTRDQYVFCGWATTNDALIAVHQPGEMYSLNEDVTLYAVWKEKECIVIDSVSDDGVNLYIENNAAGKCIVGIYDAEGKMLTCGMEEISENAGEIVVSYSRYVCDGNYTVKVFLVDSSYAPTCECVVKSFKD